VIGVVPDVPIFRLVEAATSTPRSRREDELTGAN